MKGKRGISISIIFAIIVVVFLFVVLLLPKVFHVDLLGKVTEVISERGILSGERPLLAGVCDGMNEGDSCEESESLCYDDSESLWCDGSNCQPCGSCGDGKTDEGYEDCDPEESRCTPDIFEGSCEYCNDKCQQETVYWGCNSDGAVNIYESRTLTQNLKNSSGGSYCPIGGIILDGSNIILDCAGHSITGGPGTGISINQQNNTIKNCIVYNFQYGIDSDFFPNSKITNTRIINSTIRAIRLSGAPSPNSEVSNVTIISKNANEGLYVSGLYNSVFLGINSTGSKYGLFFANCHNNTIENSAMYGNSVQQIYVRDSNLTLKNQLIYGNYSFTNAILAFEDSNEAKIQYLGQITGNGSNLSNTVKISSNFVHVDSAAESEFNVPANITVYNTDSLGLSDRTPYRNEIPCSPSTCIELADADIYIFNVTGFTNYSVGETSISCGSIITTSTTLISNLTSCTKNGLNITGSNVVLDCDGYTISGDNAGMDYGVYVKSGLSNVTVKNCRISNFTGIAAAGIYSESSGMLSSNTLTDNFLGIYTSVGFSGSIRNNLINNSLRDGIYEGSVSVNNITNNTITNSGRHGLNLGNFNARVWHNNIYGSTNYNVFAATWPAEISYNNQGGYWGRTSCPLFIAGTDSNNVAVTDNYPYRNSNGWLTGSPGDCVSPSVTIISPTPGTILGSVFYQMIGNVSDNVGISSVKVIIKNGGTNIYSASYNTSNWNYTWDTSSESEGYYNITVNATDTEGNYDTETVNNIKIDKSGPLISSISSSVSASTASISWVTNEDANSSVTYGLNFSLVNSSFSSLYTTSHSINLTGLSSSTLYYYNITSCDQIGNCQTNGTYNFTTSAEPAAPTLTEEEEESTEGGASILPSDGWTNTYFVRDNEFQSGVTRDLGTNQRSGFRVGKAYHYAGIIGMTGKTVTMQVESEPQQATLSIGEEKKFEVNNDSYYDVYIKLENINSVTNKARIFIKSIHELIPEEEKPEITEEGEEIVLIPESRLWKIVISILVIVVVLVIAYKILSKKKEKVQVQVKTVKRKTKKKRR